MPVTVPVVLLGPAASSAQASLFHGTSVIVSGACQLKLQGTRSDTPDEAVTWAGRSRCSRAGSYEALDVSLEDAHTFLAAAGISKPDAARVVECTGGRLISLVASCESLEQGASIYGENISTHRLPWPLLKFPFHRGATLGMPDAAQVSAVLLPQTGAGVGKPDAARVSACVMMSGWSAWWPISATMQPRWENSLFPICPPSWLSSSPLVESGQLHHKRLCGSDRAKCKGLLELRAFMHL